MKLHDLPTRELGRLERYLAPAREALGGATAALVVLAVKDSTGWSVSCYGAEEDADAAAPGDHKWRGMRGTSFAPDRGAVACRATAGTADAAVERAVNRDLREWGNSVAVKRIILEA